MVYFWDRVYGQCVVINDVQLQKKLLKMLEAKYETKLEFPGGKGGTKQKLCVREYGFFWTAQSWKPWFVSSFLFLSFVGIDLSLSGILSKGL